MLVTVCNFVASKWIVFREKPSKIHREHAEKMFRKFAKRGQPPFEGRLWAPYFLLAIITAGLLLLPMGTGNFFGSLETGTVSMWRWRTVCGRSCCPPADSFLSGLHWEPAAVPMTLPTTGCCGRMSDCLSDAGSGDEGHHCGLYDLLYDSFGASLLFLVEEERTALGDRFCGSAASRLFHLLLSGPPSDHVYEITCRFFFDGADRYGSAGLKRKDRSFVHRAASDYPPQFYYAPACIVALGVYVLHRCFFEILAGLMGCLQLLAVRAGQRLQKPGGRAGQGLRKISGQTGNGFL